MGGCGVDGVETRQAWLTAPGRFEIRRTSLIPREGEVLIEVDVCGLCAWELNHWKGFLGECPQLLGHEIAGRIAATGPGVPPSFAVGVEVTCFSGAGFADYTLAHHSNCFALDGHARVDHALGEPLSCVITTVRGVGPEIGDVGLMLGCGPMGLWCIQALAGNGLAALIAADVSDEKLDMARRFGATHCVNPAREPLAEAVAAITGSHMADFVIEGTGRPSSLASCVECVRAGRGRIALMSSHEEVGPAFDWRPAMSKGVQIMATHPAYALDGRDNLRRAVALMNRGAIHAEGMITHRFALDEIATAFRTLESRPVDYIKGVVQPGR